MGDDFQLQPPQFNVGWKPKYNLLGDYHLHLDPEIEAKLAELDAMNSAGWLRSLWHLPNWDDFDATKLRMSFNGPVVPPAAPLFKPGKGPDETKEAGAGDVLKALWAIPAIQDAAHRAFDSTIRRDWNRSSTGEKALVISTLAVIGGGAIAGIVRNDETRIWTLKKLEGTDIPVPGVDGLSLRISQTNYGLTVPIPRVKALTVGGNVKVDDTFNPTQIQGYDGTIKFDIAEWVRSRK